MENEKRENKTEEIIPLDEQKSIILGLIQGIQKELFNAQLLERYFQRRVLVSSSFMVQLGNTQKGIRESKEYLSFLEEILREEY